MYPNIQEYGGPLVQFSFVVSHVDCFSVFILLAFRFPIFVARAVQFSFFVFLAFWSLIFVGRAVWFSVSTRFVVHAFLSSCVTISIFSRFVTAARPQWLSMRTRKQHVRMQYSPARVCNCWWPPGLCSVATSPTAEMEEKRGSTLLWPTV